MVDPAEQAPPLAVPRASVPIIAAVIVIVPVGAATVLVVADSTPDHPLSPFGRVARTLKKYSVSGASSEATALVDVCDVTPGELMSLDRLRCSM